MKALSIKQPWAWLICAGFKDIENRNWPIGRNSRHGPYISYHQANFTYNDTPDDALYRAETIKALGIKPFLMRYQPLNALVKDNYIGNWWNDREMRRFQRYWCRQNWLSKIPYAEFTG